MSNEFPPELIEEARKHLRERLRDFRPSDDRVAEICREILKERQTGAADLVAQRRAADADAAANASPAQAVTITAWNNEVANNVKAPYAFATLNSDVVEADPSPDIDRPVEGGLSATIEVEWQFETPFLVGAGEDSSSPFVIQSPVNGKGGACHTRCEHTRHVAGRTRNPHPWQDVPDQSTLPVCAA
ncbi:MAG: hypothetical protein R3D34_15900 [Nitratireductor sp.]